MSESYFRKNPGKVSKNCKNVLQKYFPSIKGSPKTPVANLRGRADPLLRSRGSWRARGAWGGTQNCDFWCKPCSNKPIYSAVLSPVNSRSSSYRALASASRGSRGVPGAGPEREEARSLNGGVGRARFGGEEMQVSPRNPSVPPGDGDRDAALLGEYAIISGSNGCVFASTRPNVRPNSPLFPAKSPP